MLTWISNSLFPNSFFRAPHIAILLAVVASGCASFAPAPTDLAVDGFIVSGRIAVRTEADGFSGNFRWQNRSGGFDIELWGPMGQGRSRLVGDGSSVTLYSADGAIYREPDTETAMRRWLGVDVPVSALTHWIKGVPAPTMRVDAKTMDAAGDLTQLAQHRWQLTFDRYQTHDSDRRLPGRVIAERGPVRVTLLPKQWWFGTGTP